VHFYPEVWGTVYRKDPETKVDVLFRDSVKSATVPGVVAQDHQSQGRAQDIGPLSKEAYFSFQNVASLFTSSLLVRKSFQIFLKSLETVTQGTGVLSHRKGQAGIRVISLKMVDGYPTKSSGG
jgi:hypothetical protein